ncbi:UNVERIFIED_CONTAM: hypothetical protein GTU68_013440 [Idotea baltica]|nr:hypothetical protein [Idotea baltica]
MKHYAIIVAGGTGSRMGADIPKQFLSYGNKPIIIHTLQKFINSKLGIEIVLVVHADFTVYTQNLVNQHFTNSQQQSIQITEGGETRFHSVKNGLDLLSPTDNDLVAVHDSVRSLLSIDLINHCYNITAEKGNAIPAVAVTNSIRTFTDIEQNESKALDRSQLRSVQTPQCFKLATLKDAYNTNFKESFTDSASVAEHSGIKINLIEGEANNIKITRPIDLKLAELLSEVW